MSSWESRFARFNERKTREALAAGLPPYVTEFDREASDALAIGNAWTRRIFDGPFYRRPAPDARRPACALVFVQSLDGNTRARNPQSLGGGETDKHLIYEGLTRADADAVLAGAGTIRDSQMIFSVWHPELVSLRASLGKPRHPVQVVATLSGLDIDNGLLFNVPEVPVIVVTVDATAARLRPAIESRPWLQLLVMKDAADLPAAFDELRGRGVGRISAIGGRTMAEQLIAANLVQDLYLTTSPIAGGERDTPWCRIPIERTVVLRKRGTREETGVRFEHITVRRRA